MADNGETEKLLVIPCSGVGKVHGLMSREAAYHVTDKLLPKAGGYRLPGSARDRRCRDEAESPAKALRHFGRLPEALRIEERRVVGREDCQKHSRLRRDEAPPRCELRHRDRAKRRRDGRPSRNLPARWLRLRSRNRKSEVIIMAEAVSKIGIISCSGEEIPEGTIARQAVRRVLEGLRPQQSVTLACRFSWPARWASGVSPASTPRSPWTAARSSAPNEGPNSTAAR